jgi:hypothetical protein
MIKLNRYRVYQLILILLGVFWLRGVSSSPAVTWMSIYVIEDFAHFSWGDIYTFLSQNKLPLPPVISFLELATYKVFGTTYLVTIFLYKFAFIAPYVIVLSFARTSPYRFNAVFLISCLFLFCSIAVHRGNPQGYDVVLPLLIMLFIHGVNRSFNSQVSGSKVKYAIWAGFCLSLAELTRPFMIYLLPVLIGLVLLRYLMCEKSIRIRLATAFLVPLILISGSLHLSLYMNHQQLNFSNHAGFNLHRAWSRLVPLPVLLVEPSVPTTNPERGENFNTREHQINSERIQKAIFKHWVSQPVQSISFGLSLIRDFMSAPTAIYEHNPTSIFLETYRLLYQLLSALLIINFLVLIYRVAFFSKTKIDDLAMADNLILLIGSSLIVVFAISEKAEEARFVISTLPFVAALAVVRNSAQYPEQSASHRLSFNW